MVGLVGVVAVQIIDKDPQPFLARLPVCASEEGAESTEATCVGDESTHSRPEPDLIAFFVVVRLKNNRLLVID